MRKHHQSVRRFAQLLAGLAIIISIISLVLAVAGRSAEYEGWGIRGYPATVGTLLTIVGLLIVSRQPRQAVGWLAILIGLASAIQGSLLEYAIYTTELYPDFLPGGAYVAWVLNWYWLVVVLGIVILLFLFPDGRLPSPRWRVVFWAVVFLYFLEALVIAFRPGPLESTFPALNNPFGIIFIQQIPQFVQGLFMPGFIAGAWAMIVKFRRSGQVQRQQIKWFVFAAILVALTVPTAASAQLWSQIPFMLAGAFVPIAIGIAITRYRLYDVDIIVRRTLIYGVITALLIAVYFALVVLLQSLFTAVTGQQSALAIVITTLAIAALFNPLRQRVQAFIDRRFYRRKYDAAQTLAQFAETARDEVDLEQLSQELLLVVKETMQPEHVSLWLNKH